MDTTINMFTTEELARMLDLRGQMDDLQARYDAIVKTAAERLAAAAGAGSQGMAEVAPVAWPRTVAPVKTVNAPAQRITPAPTAALPSPAMPVPTPAAVPGAPTPPPAAPPANPPRPVVAADPNGGPAQADAAAAQATPGPESATVGQADGMLRDAVVRILTQAGTPLDIEMIFKKLEENGAPLPADKPKLVLRRLLHTAGLFQVVKGKFAVK